MSPCNTRHAGGVMAGGVMAPSPEITGTAPLHHPKPESSIRSLPRQGIYRSCVLKVCSTTSMKAGCAHHSKCAHHVVSAACCHNRRVWDAQTLGDVLLDLPYNCGRLHQRREDVRRASSQHLLDRIMCMRAGVDIKETCATSISALYSILVYPWERL